MLAFDIETTGLSPVDNLITVVCTQDYFTGERTAYEFDKVRKTDPVRFQVLVDSLVKAFDTASSLCAFNGIRFDIPFLQKSLNITPNVTNAWILKTTDILEACRLGKFGPYHTFSLNLLCEHNAIPVKTSSGKAAIIMAKKRQWIELKSYCTEDVRILCDLYNKRHLQNPRGHKTMDLSLISHPDLYTTNPNLPTNLGEITMAESSEQLMVDTAVVPEADSANRILELEKKLLEVVSQLQIYKDFWTCI